MSDTFLEKIIARKKILNQGKQPFFRAIAQQLDKNTYSRYGVFKKALGTEGLSLIAEIKKASPSKGMIRESFDLIQCANIYQDCGAQAISVLTEQDFFLGQPQFVRKVSELIHLPVLAKDFFIDRGQIYEARLNGASAILLIAALLEDNQIKQFMRLAHRLDMDCLLETHNEDEVKRAVDLGAEIIGINNRNLSSFEVDIETSFQLKALIPEGVIVVAESGIKTRQDMTRLRDSGFNAVLIGETFMAAEDVGQKVLELMQE